MQKRNRSMLAKSNKLQKDLDKYLTNNIEGRLKGLKNE